MRIIVLAGALWALSASIASAQLEVRGFGPRIGATSAPDQILLGAHLDMGEFTQDLAFRPHGQIGLGGDLFSLAGAADVYYRFHLPDTTWMPTVGGTLGVFYADLDRGGSFTDLELMATGGLEKRLDGGTWFHFELKLELVDAPDLSFVAGWTF